MTGTTTDAEKVRKAIESGRPAIGRRSAGGDLLGTGSTLLNLACSGDVRGGWPKGSYVFLVGDSVSGKTFLAMTCLAEASVSPHFADYRLIYDDVEGGALMDVERFFGKAAAERLEPPAIDDDCDPVCSATVEDFYYHLDDALEGNRPFIYVLDSMDGLSSAFEWSKFRQRKKAMREGTEAKGDYGDGKAKANSSGLRKVLSGLRDTGSILVVINQTRDNVGAAPFQPKKTRSGGHALRFYATLELWSSVKKRLKRTRKGKSWQVGVLSKVAVKKNRITGREWSVDIPIYYSTGIDDIGGCVDFLIDNGRWSMRGNRIKATDFSLSGTKEKLVRKIEDEGWEKDLREVVSEVWHEIEETTAVKRKRRYQ